jgi:hypothetical protein
MRTIKINPDSINNEIYSGWVEVELPEYVQKIRSLRELKFKIDDKGEMIPCEDKLEQLELMGTLARKVIISAEITRKEDGKVFDKEDIFYSNDFQALIVEATTAYMSGFTPSKK